LSFRDISEDSDLAAAAAAAACRLIDEDDSEISRLAGGVARD